MQSAMKSLKELDSLPYSIELGITPSIDDLLEVIRKTSAQPVNGSSKDTIYLLYNSDYTHNKRFSALAAEAAELYPGKITVVGDSHVGQLINDRLFKLLLNNAIRKEVCGTLVGDITVDQQLKIEAMRDRLMSGSERFGDGPNDFRRVSDYTDINGGKGSIWDIASEKFAKENTGRFEFFTRMWESADEKNIVKNSTFGWKELNAILENDKNIFNGLPVSSYSKNLEEALLEAVELGAIRTSIGEAEFKRFNFYLESIKDPNYWGEKLTQDDIYKRIEADLSKVPKEDISLLRKILSSKIAAESVKSIGFLTPILLYVTFEEAKALEAEGKFEEAEKLREDTLAGEAGSAFLGFAAGALAAMAIGGPVGIAGFAFVLLVGLAGGMYGDTAGKDVWAMIKEQALAKTTRMRRSIGWLTTT